MASFLLISYTKMPEAVKIAATLRRDVNQGGGACPSQGREADHLGQDTCSTLKRDLSCVIVTPVGPGHAQAAGECENSVRSSIQVSKGPFARITHTLIDDRFGSLGPARARNLGMEKALEEDPDWVAFLDADDILIPTVFDLLRPYIGGYDGIWGQIYHFRESKNGRVDLIKMERQLEFTTDMKDILFMDPALTLCVGHFLKTNVAIKALFEMDHEPAEAFHHFLRIWSGHRCIKIPHPLCGKRISGSSTDLEISQRQDRNSAQRRAIRKYKFGNIHLASGEDIPVKTDPKSMDVAIFGIMRSGTTLLEDQLCVKDQSLILYEPDIHLHDYGMANVVKQLKGFGFHISDHDLQQKAKTYSTVRQFFDSEILPLVSTLAFWGVKVVDFTDWEGFLAAYKPRRMILCVRDIRDVIISAFDLALRLNRAVVDEYWIERRAVLSCRALVLMFRLPHFLVRYEDMCSHPEIIEAAAKYVGLNRIEGGHLFRDVVSYRCFETQKHGNAISRGSIGRYKKEPPGPVLALADRVWRLCPEYSAVFGYEHPSGYHQVNKTHNPPQKCSSDYQDLSCIAEGDPALSRRKAREAAARFIPPRSVVLDLSCGTMSLETMLPASCRYIPCDVVARDDRTLVYDFNQIGNPPEIDDVTVVVGIGLLEYISDMKGFLQRLRRYGSPVVLSCSHGEDPSQPAPYGSGRDTVPGRNAWAELVRNTGFSIRSTEKIDESLTLFDIVPCGQPEQAEPAHG